MSKKSDQPDSTLVCPKCSEPLIFEVIRELSEEKRNGTFKLTEGHGGEALTLSRLIDHYKSGTHDLLKFNYDHHIDFVVIGCKKCGHILGIVPSGTESIVEEISGLWGTVCDEAENTKLGMLAVAKGVLAELRKLQFGDKAHDAEWECQYDEATQSDQEAVDINKPNTEAIAQQITGAIAAVVDASVEKHLSRAIDRLSETVSQSIASSVATAVEAKMSELEKRAGTLSKNNDGQETPVPVRIVEIDPEVKIRVEDDGQEREVRVTNTPLDVRQLPG